MAKTPRTARSADVPAGDAAALVADMTGDSAPNDGVVSKALAWIRAKGGVDVPREPGGGAARPEGGAGVDWLIGEDGVSTQALVGGGETEARDRQSIYRNYGEMLQDGLVSQALHLHVTSALGGHESMGQLVFIEAAPGATAQQKAACADMQARLGRILDKSLPEVCFDAVAYGDGYARPLGTAGEGLTSVLTGELVMPPLVQPYERGGVTVGYLVATGLRGRERLNIMQLARLKLPRMGHVPQPRAEERAVRTNLLSDDVEQMLAMPADVGGSFLAGAERDFADYKRAKAGIVAQRARNTIDETWLAVNMQSMPPGMQKRFLTQLTSIANRAGAFYESMAATGRYWFGKLVHHIPVSSEKQVVEIKSSSAQGSGPANITIDDVMFHARLLAGKLGMDISMLGFADILSGGLGEGGFLRTSVQVAERSRILRVAASEWVNHLLSLDQYWRTGQTYTEADQFWRVQFFGGISAQQAEQAKTKADSVGSASMLVAAIAQLKELGFGRDALLLILKTQFGLNEEEAAVYAADLAKSVEEGGAPGQPDGEGEGTQ
ncbi:hypothetical protein [Ideonella livida]|uniref:Phage portal protein n=1 Tax=Ideonella livida TaxID=2707176 RepID=A0A7C9TJJ7_9BURK|nr:hypothetical protein [Ideonella livida]NDY89706.1 hypothetical protein [Ideonella livida]